MVRTISSHGHFHHAPPLWDCKSPSWGINGTGTPQSRTRTRTFVALAIASTVPFATVRTIGSAQAQTVKVVKESPEPDSVIPKWCFNKTPAFIFWRDKALIRAQADGSKTEKLIEVDRFPSPRSLVCSLDGRTIFFLSQDYTRAYVYENRRLGAYAVSFSVPGSVRFGMLMSPDGSTFAVPSGITHIAGDDLLKRKRLLPVNSTDVFWTTNKAFYRIEKNVFGVADRANLKQETSFEIPPGLLVNGIYECGRDQLYLLFGDETDERHMVGLTREYAIGPAIFARRLVGAADSIAEQCVVSLVRENDLGLSIVDRLGFVSGQGRTLVNIESLALGNDEFALAKDGRLLVTFHREGIEGKTGKILILEHSKAPLGDKP